MQSGFTGGAGAAGAAGVPDFYAGGRSISIATAMNNHHQHPSQPPYHRSSLPGLFLDTPSSQIARQTQSQSQFQPQNPSTLIGKRTLAEFQAHQHHHHYHNPNQNLYLRSLKPRTFQHSSPISPLSPIDFSSSSTITGSDSSSSASSLLSHQRFGLPLLQQLRPQPVHQTLPPAGSYVNNNPVQNQTRVVSGVDSEKKMISYRLQELEKQLLDDNDEKDEGDAVSVITKTSSEWSETIQNLIGAGAGPGPGQSQKPVTPSPTSSSSSSSSVASPASSTCSNQSLMEAATAISEGKSEAAAEILTRLTTSEVPNPRPNSEQRLLEVMALALKSRINPVDNPPPVTELFSQEHAGATQLLYELSPCFRFGFMAANLAILEATLTDKSRTNKVHVIDFDIGQGGQYMLLLHALSARLNGMPATVKITTVADNGGEDRLTMVRQNLSKVAKQHGVVLEFNIVSQKLAELNRDSLGCEPDEPIAVNFAFKLYSIPDESVSTDNPRDELLRRVKGLSPCVVTLVEQELNTNTAPFMARVKETCLYFGAVLESMKWTEARDNSERVKAEEALSRKLINSVACEGRDRVERCEVFGKWRARMGMAGFELRPMSQNVTEVLKQRLSSGNHRVNSGFTVKEENGGVCFGWISRTLTVASAWR